MLSFWMLYALMCAAVAGYYKSPTMAACALWLCFFPPGG